MASKLGTALRIIGLWALVPAGLAALGYYVIGPRIGASTADAPEKQPADSSDEEVQPGRSFAEPKVEVSVKKGSTISQRDIQRSRRRPKPKPKPTPSTPDVEPPPATQQQDPPPTGETIPVSSGGDG